MQSVLPARSVAERVSALRAGQPADITVRNLMSTLTSKLELSSRLQVFELEAREDGCDACADVFQQVAAAEHEQISALLAGLKSHLDLHENPAPAPPAGS
jgi:hypothetical protein